jgi:FkbM family methyltransferase
MVAEADPRREGDIITGHIAVDTAWMGRTPGGAWYAMSIRPGSSDWDTCNANSYGMDEYRIPRGRTGWALDIGAHIGACTVPLLLDNPDLRVIAVEALPENVEYLRTNLARNGVEDRAIIVHAAASDVGGVDQIIGYGPSTGPNAHSQYIGSGVNPMERERSVAVKTATLRGLMLLRGPEQDAPFVWTKIDCEGCEYGVFKSEWNPALRFITGEVHFGWDRMVELLAPTHDIMGPGTDFGPFEAVAR